MFLLSNGAFKSGSTWLYMILELMTDYPAPPKKYLNSDWYNPSIHPQKLSDFLEHANYNNNDFLCKNHFYKEKDLILSYKNVFVVGITRNIRDVIVSAYYHDCRVDGFTGSFEDYYWKRGQSRAKAVINYNNVWNVKSPNVYVSSYESLKSNFHIEVSKIGKFLEIPINEEKITEIAKKTNIDKLKKTQGAHFRKGIIGDWKNHFKEEITRDLELIEKESLGNKASLTG